MPLPCRRDAFASALFSNSLFSKPIFSKPIFSTSLFSIMVLAACMGFSQPSGASQIEGLENENFVGRSLGGNVRKGPGLEFDAMQSVEEGTWLTIVRSSGVVMDGYDWFEVRFDDGMEGFMWGGILCSNGQLLTGVYEQCVN